MARNARFWTWHNGGWVRITLRPQQSLTAVVAQRTDEGYSCESTTWEHTGAEVLCTWGEHGRDCDGRYERSGESVCPLYLLKYNAAIQFHEDSPPTNVGIFVPAWEKVSAEQRDYAAEAMGY